jgi:hypothetical protein
MANKGDEILNPPTPPPEPSKYVNSFNVETMNVANEKKGLFLFFKF